MGSDVVSCVEATGLFFWGRIEPCKKQGLTSGSGKVKCVQRCFSLPFRVLPSAFRVFLYFSWRSWRLCERLSFSLARSLRSLKAQRSLRKARTLSSKHLFTHSCFSWHSLRLCVSAGEGFSSAWGQVFMFFSAYSAVNASTVIRKILKIKIRPQRGMIQSLN